MITSRCGIQCDEINCKEAYGFDCAGCTNIEKAPWGDCPVKVCAEDKKLEHCGECEKFPCDLLTNYSYDKEHGDEGRRIEQCKCWLKEKEMV